MGFGDFIFIFDVYDILLYLIFYVNGEFLVEVVFNDYLYFEYSVKLSVVLVVFVKICKVIFGLSFYLLF